MLILAKLVKRLNRIGIEIQMVGNYPWIYLDTINGKKVKERFRSDHGFTIAMMNARTGNVQITDIQELFKTIRNYR